MSDPKIKEGGGGGGGGGERLRVQNTISNYCVGLYHFIVCPGHSTSAWSVNGHMLGLNRRAHDYTCPEIVDIGV